MALNTQALKLVPPLQHIEQKQHSQPLSADDNVWLDKARSEQRILVTDDKDFGELVFRRKLPSAGVILLRLHRLPLPDRLRWLQSRWNREWEIVCPRKSDKVIEASPLLFQTKSRFAEAMVSPDSLEMK